MRTIYVDNEYHCHVSNNGTMKVIETNFFDGKCDEYVEGHCYDDSNGYVSVYACKPYSGLDATQRQYEKQLLSETQEALSILLGGVS